VRVPERVQGGVDTGPLRKGLEARRDALGRVGLSV
jgi:hypothetical protein